MAILSIFSTNFSGTGELVKKIKTEKGYSVYTDADIISYTSNKFKEKKRTLEKAFFPPNSIFNNSTSEKEKSTAMLKHSISEILCDKQIIYGFSSMLINNDINHVAKILTIADHKYRTAYAKKMGLKIKAIKKEINHADENAALFVHKIHNSSPWKPSLYDIVIPMDKTSVKEAYKIILEQLEKPVLEFTQTSQKKLNEFHIQTKVELELSRHGYQAEVKVDNCEVTLTINKKVLFLSKFETELKKIAGKVPGVFNVKTKIGPNFNKADICRDYNFNSPPKILLVDDEVDFVQALSERLSIRELPSHTVFSGREALEIMNKEHPEVMVVDLKMPGVDGYEVLRETKKNSPDTEVIILTGHGSDADKRLCMNLGAFAYLEKPTDINLLTKTMKAAYENIQKNSLIKSF